MPFQYEKDDTQQVVIATGAGPFDMADVLALADRLRIDRTWSYALIMDIRRLTGELGLAELRRISEIAAAADVGTKGRGPLAIVASDPTMYGMACAYVAMSPGRVVDVFRDRDEAELWLTRHHTPH